MDFHDLLCDFNKVSIAVTEHSRNSVKICNIIANDTIIATVEVLPTGEFVNLVPKYENHGKESS